MIITAIMTADMGPGRSDLDALLVAAKASPRAYAVPLTDVSANARLLCEHSFDPTHLRKPAVASNGPSEFKLFIKKITKLYLSFLIPLALARSRSLDL